MPIDINGDIIFHSFIGEENKEVRIKLWSPENDDEIHELGRASAANIGMALHMAIKYCRDFAERVYCYKIENGDLAAMMTQQHKKIREDAPTYGTIIFYEKVNKGVFD